jgi:two-component system chemotaxis response regulator CheY
LSKILLVDSSLLDRKRMRSVLEAAGHLVVETMSPGDAIGLISQAFLGDLDVVVTELNFALALGTDLIRWLKNYDSRLAVIVATVQPTREQVIELVSMGVATVITKPFGPDLLLRRVTETLAERSTPMNRRRGDSGYAR